MNDRMRLRQLLGHLHLPWGLQHPRRRHQRLWRLGSIVMVADLCRHQLLLRRLVYRVCTTVLGIQNTVRLIYRFYVVFADVYCYSTSGSLVD